MPNGEWMFVNDVLFDNFQNIYLVGGTVLPDNYQSYDGFIQKLDPLGNPLINKRIFTNVDYSDKISSVSILDNGNFAFTLSSNDNQGEFSNSYFAKLNQQMNSTIVKSLSIGYFPMLIKSNFYESNSSILVNHENKITIIEYNPDIMEIRRKSFIKDYSLNPKKSLDNKYIIGGACNTYDPTEGWDNHFSLNKLSMENNSCLEIPQETFSISNSSLNFEAISVNVSNSYDIFVSGITLVSLSIILQDTILCPECTNPVSNFSASQTTGICPFSVDFFDLSQTSGSTSWLWTIYTGDETPIISTQKNPSGILFENSGSFLVSLEVTDECGSNIKSVQDYITVTFPNSTDEKVGNKRIFEIFPNPTTNFLTIKAKDLTEELYNISMINVMGDLIKQTYFTVSDNKSEMTFDVSDLPLGVYFISIKSTKSTISKLKVIKQ